MVGNYLRVPHSETHGAFFNIFQHDWSRPVPFHHKVEELRQDGCATSEGIELTDTSYHNSPRDTTRVTEHCAIYCAFYDQVSNHTRIFMAESYGLTII